VHGQPSFPPARAAATPDARRGRRSSRRRRVGCRPPGPRHAVPCTLLASSEPGTRETVISSITPTFAGTAKVISQPLLAISLRAAEWRVRSRYASARKDLPRKSNVASTRTVVKSLDPTIRELIGHALAGAVVGWGVLAGLVATNTVGLRSLLEQADLGGLALALLTFQFGLGFATFAIVTALAFPLGIGRRLGKTVAPCPEDGENDCGVNNRSLSM
jgi:hypothetical protein